MRLAEQCSFDEIDNSGLWSRCARAGDKSLELEQELKAVAGFLMLKKVWVFAQYVNCAAANSGADAGMYDASEQYKLSTWQQVPHRGSPFRDKGGLRGQRQKRVLFEKDTT